ncbi:META domain-containing protein [Paenarthrobacter sp. GOM3]|uniref:META domain-containing protein n=1 Tax=Paenarthrobacter sp. GOM3 TaxID=2782567 RepID=UPI001BAE3444|nr:META domain-containing protein [Paenarthrobacter sp. GOM3]WOH19045.1 META domain-containing protein [Paenarthrobacter sp. GOM3]
MMQTQQRICRAVSLAIVTAALLAGCSGSNTSPFVGVWGDPTNLGKPSLDLHAYGAASGTDGCNRLIGSWKEDAKTITFGGFATSRMACEGVDTWLSTAATAKIQEDGKLAVFGQDGKQIGTLNSKK